MLDVGDAYLIINFPFDWEIHIQYDNVIGDLLLLEWPQSSY